MTQQNIEVSSQPVPSLLRRLERELAPFADAASPPLSQRTVRRSFILRIFERVALAAALLMTIGSLWIFSERSQGQTDANPSTDRSAETLQRELNQLKQTLSNVEAERDKLREELQAERGADLAKPYSWHDDLIGLSYRSPWPTANESRP